MIAELDLVVLTRDVAAHGLQRGDIGTVVHRYADGQTFEVEFVTAEGTTVAVLTLGQADVRPVRGREILHARDLSVAPA